MPITGPTKHWLSRSDAQLWDGEGKRHLANGEFAAVHRVLGLLERHGADSYLVHVFRGNVLGLEGRFEEAAESLEYARSLDPRGTLALIDSGDISLLAGRPAQALFFCSSAVELLDSGEYDADPEGEMEEVSSIVTRALKSLGRAHEMPAALEEIRSEIRRRVK